MHLSLTDLERLDKRNRSNFINALSGVKSANLIGTSNENKQTNLSIVSSVVHLGSDPPLIGFIQRPTTVERHTYENIINTENFTINAVNTEIVKQAHQTSARYKKEQSEFDEVGLTPEWLNEFKAPFVLESFLKIGVELEEIIPISSNNTELIVGKIQDVYLPSEIYNSDGSVSLDKISAVGINGLDTYLEVKKLVRLSYAKPNTPLKEI